MLRLGGTTVSRQIKWAAR